MAIRKEEEIARKNIEKYLLKLCNKGTFIIADELNDENNKSPDLQNYLDDIGIEVTIAEPQEELRIQNSAFTKKTDEAFLNTRSANAWSEPLITEDGYRFLVGKYSSPDVYFNMQKEPLKVALHKKLNKLNTTKNRKYFTNNGLFIINEMPFKNKEKIDEIYDLIILEQNIFLENNPGCNSFDFVIILAQTIPELLIYFDLHNKANNIIINKNK